MDTALGYGADSVANVRVTRMFHMKPSKRTPLDKVAKQAYRGRCDRTRYRTSRDTSGNAPPQEIPRPIGMHQKGHHGQEESQQAKAAESARSTCEKALQDEGHRSHGRRQQIQCFPTTAYRRDALPGLRGRDGTPSRHAPAETREVSTMGRSYPRGVATRQRP